MKSRNNLARSRVTLRVIAALCFGVIAAEAAYLYGLCVKGNHWYIRIPYSCVGGNPKCERVNCHDQVTGLHVNCDESCRSGDPLIDICYGNGSTLVTKRFDYKNCNPNRDPTDPETGCVAGGWSGQIAKANQSVTRKNGTPCLGLPNSEWLIYYNN